MALDRRLLDLLCCPVTKMPLALAAADALERLRIAAAAGQLQQRDGSVVAQAPQVALIESRSGWYYPVLDDIPVLLPEVALRVNETSLTQ